MLADHFPPAGLTLRTPRLELRLPSPDELGDLAGLAAAGVHDPARTPFLDPWTDQPPDRVAQSVLRQHWARLAAWNPSDWSLGFAVFRDGTVVGEQVITAEHLAVTREVSTGSWLGLPFHGRGFGTEMRAAVLHLAFAGLGAEEAASTAFDDNHASHTVSRKLGYRPDGIRRRMSRGAPAPDRRLRLTRAAWREHRTVSVTIDGLPPCLPLFGLAGSLG